MRIRGIFLTMVILASIMVFLGSVPCYAGEAKGVTKDTIIMGHLNADTGPIAKDSQGISEAIKNYIRYINEQGGIHGRKIKFVSEDTGYSIPRAMAAFKKILYKDNVFTIFGPTSTGEATVLLPQVQKEKICTVMISPAEHMFKPFKRYVFHFVCSYENQIKILFDYILKDMKAKFPNPRIAIVYPDVEVGKSAAREAQIQAKVFNVELREEILNMGSLDASSQVMNLKRYKPDFVIIQHVIAPASLLLREARKLKLETNFLGTMLSTNADTIALSKDAAQGYVGIQAFRSWYSNTPGAKKMREITLKLRPGTDKPYRSEYYTFGWVNAILFVEGMKRAGKDLNNESLVNAMETIKNFDPWGLSGSVTWGSDDREGAESVFFSKADVDNGMLVAISDWKKPLPR
ncbi:MAG: ABC transporter substrate-binding protein [Thermodesulfobacteriota bacterium]